MTSNCVPNSFQKQTFQTFQNSQIFQSPKTPTDLHPPTMAAHMSRMAAMEKELNKFLGSFEDSDRAKEQVLEAVNRIFGKKVKGRSGPKKPANAYILFTQEKRSEIVTSLTEELGEKPSTGAVTKRAGEMWKALDSEAQAPYLQKRAELMAEFEAEHPDLVKSTRSSTPKSAFEFDRSTPEDMDVPNGWSPAQPRKYLKSNAAGITLGEGKFATLTEAIAAADALGSKCGGVTRTSRGFFLRKGNDAITETTAKKRETTWSWFKLDFEVPVEQAKPKKVKQAKKATALPVAVPEPVAEPVAEDLVTPVAPDSSLFVSAMSVSSSIADDAFDSDTDDDDDDDDEASVSTWDHKGKTYLVNGEDDEDCDVFDFSTQEKIGRRANKGGKWKLLKA
jgi:hypothetical protein